LKPRKREVIDHLLQFLKKYGVPAFEYFTGNESGEEWRKKLTEELDKTTVFVPLLTNEYERSPVCTEEWDAIEKSKTKIKMLPFLLNDRTDPFVKLKGLHHQTLSQRSVLERMWGTQETCRKFPERMEQPLRRSRLRFGRV
jgi:hypothetical protein